MPSRLFIAASSRRKLSAADLLGRYPQSLALISCQPLDLENWGGPLTEPVTNSIEPALDAARSVLSEWGVTLRTRAKDELFAALLANDIDHHGYETRADSAF